MKIRDTKRGLLESLGRHQSHIVTGTVRAEPKDAAFEADPYATIGALNQVGFLNFCATHFALYHGVNLLCLTDLLIQTLPRECRFQS